MVPRGFFPKGHVFDPSVWMSACKEVFPPSTYKKVRLFSILCKMIYLSSFFDFS